MKVPSNSSHCWRRTAVSFSKSLLSTGCVIAACRLLWGWQLARAGCRGFPFGQAFLSLFGICWLCNKRKIGNSKHWDGRLKRRPQPQWGLLKQAILLMANKIKARLQYSSVTVKSILTLKVILPICGIQRYKNCAIFIKTYCSWCLKISALYCVGCQGLR